MGSVHTENCGKQNLPLTLNVPLSNATNFKIASKDPLLYKCQEEGIIREAVVSKIPYIRAVSKKGECNIYPSKVKRKHLIRDIFTTLLDLKWRYTLTIFVLGFVVSWTFFGMLWYLLAFYHGDLELNHLPANQAASNWTPCVTDIHDFTSCILFSVETQQTTGYGEKRPTEKCADAVLLMCLQNVIGLMVDAFLVGIFFAKLMKPKRRTHTIQFSKYAVISLREKTLCLIFRLGDMRYKSRVIEATVKAQMVNQVTSKEGGKISIYLTKLPISIDDCGNDLLFIWPTSVIHKITPSSPLYNISKNDLTMANFEIVVSLEGTKSPSQVELFAMRNIVGPKV